MKCKYCTEDMIGLTCGDNPKTGFAQNIYYCERCNTLLQNRVWNNKGNTWIKEDGSVENESF